MKSTVRATASAVAACMFILTAQAAPAPACVKGADETALQTRTVQTDLMVAALSCSASSRYNDFVKGNQAALMAAHTQLTSFFTKKRGGQKAMNAFITKLANDASRRSVGDIARFCQETGWLYDAILSPQRGDLSTFMRPLLVAQRHGYTPCEPRASYVVMGPNGPSEVAAATPSIAAPAATPPGKPVGDIAGIPTPRAKPPALAQR